MYKQSCTPFQESLRMVLIAGVFPSQTVKKGNLRHNSFISFEDNAEF